MTQTELDMLLGTYDDPYEAYCSALAHRLENHWIDQ